MRGSVLSVQCHVALLLPRVELVHEARKLLQAQLEQARAHAGDAMNQTPADMTHSTPSLTSLRFVCAAQGGG